MFSRSKRAQLPPIAAQTLNECHVDIEREILYVNLNFGPLTKHSSKALKDPAVIIVLVRIVL
jgi:hypothetical protein